MGCVNSEHELILYDVIFRAYIFLFFFFNVIWPVSHYLKWINGFNFKMTLHERRQTIVPFRPFVHFVRSMQNYISIARIHENELI